MFTQNSCIFGSGSFAAWQIASIGGGRRHRNFAWKASVQQPKRIAAVLLSNNNSDMISPMAPLIDTSRSTAKQLFSYKKSENEAILQPNSVLQKISSRYATKQLFDDTFMSKVIIFLLVFRGPFWSRLGLILDASLAYFEPDMRPFVQSWAIMGSSRVHLGRKMGPLGPHSEVEKEMLPNILRSRAVSSLLMHIFTYALQSFHIHIYIYIYIYAHIRT